MDKNTGIAYLALKWVFDYYWEVLSFLELQWKLESVFKQGASEIPIIV